MLSRKFTFFCVFLGFDLMGTIIPGIDQAMLGGLPLLILVSGWRYAGYFVLITEILSIPSWIRLLPTLSSMLKISRNPQTVTSFLYQYLPHTTTPTVFNPTLALAIAAGIIVFLIIFIPLFFYSTYKGLKLYIQLLRRARAVARRMV